MHELTIAEAICDRAIDVATERDAATIEELTVRIGERTHVNPSQLAFCIETVGEGTMVADATITTTTVDSHGTCECGWSGHPPTIADAPTPMPTACCPECGDRLTFTQGKECHLASVTLPDTHTATPTPDPES